MQNEIRKWAEEYVPRFNQLAKENDCCFYTQSPLNKITSEVDLMIIGINPGCGGCYEKDMTVDIFLAGNPEWDKRFDEQGFPHKKWGRFLNGVHTFCGYDRYKHAESIDNDSKTVWANLTPFSTARANELNKKKALLEIGVESTAKLMLIIKPKRILLLGKEAFDWIKKANVLTSFEYENAFHNRVPFSIGRINNIPAYCVVHPTGHWPISHDFTTQILDFMKKNDVVENGVPKYSISQLIEMLDKDSLIQDQIK